MTTAIKRTKGIPNAQVTGGIDPNRAYALNEFMVIAGLSRQTLSRLRTAGLIIRDTGAGTPTVLGSDWITFVASRPVHTVKPRGKHNPKNPSV